MRILAIDPGNQTGMAWCSDGSIIYAETVSHAHSVSWSPRFSHPLWIGDKHLVIIECPTVYAARFQKGDQRDIVKLAIKVGEHKHAWESRGVTVELVEPRTWKGQIPKEIHHKRIRAQMSAQELSTIGNVDHNAWDAIGLALWASKRQPT